MISIHIDDQTELALQALAESTGQTVQVLVEKAVAEMLFWARVCGVNKEGR